MDSLFEVLYTYASEHLYLSPEEREEQKKSEQMARHALEELKAKGYGELAQRVEDGLEIAFWLSQRGFLRAGLSIGMALNRRKAHRPL